MDASDAALIQQSELLREIRDELRGSRAMSSAVSSGVASTGAEGRSGAGFAARAQAMSDRVMSADFANFGWTQAFSPIYKSTVLGDAMGALGMSPGSGVLTAPEHHAMSLENLSLRAQNLVGGVIAPHYTSRTSALADEIFANSPRFARFGNSSSPLGVGMSRSASLQMARGLQMEALGNIRMSTQDAASVTTIGMQTGQFDSASTMTDLVSKIRELAAATMDVTRTMRISAEEAAKALGSLRSVGITDIGTQRNTLLAVGASAQVAGMTTGEMMSVALGGASTGVSLGLGGSASMVGAARLAAQVRELTSAGAIDQHVIARGGGAAAVAQNIFSAQAQFATSDTGFYAFLGQRGGANGGFIDSMVGGLAGVAEGGFHGFMGARRLRSQMTAQMTDRERAGLSRSFINQQIGLFGITDMTSDRAQDIAYDQAVTMGMDDSAAQAFVSANYTQAGQLAADRATMNTSRAQHLQERKLEADERFGYTTFGGRFAQLRGRIGQAWAGVGNAVADQFSLGQTGFMGFGANVDQQMGSTRAGTTTQTASLVGLMRGMNGGGQMGGGTVYSPGGNLGWGVAGSSMVGIGAVAGSMMLGAKFGGMVGLGAGPLGLLVGGAIGGIVGAGAGALAGLGVTALAAGGGADNETLDSAQAKNYAEVARAMKRTNAANGRDLLASGKLNNSAAFRTLLAEGANRGEMDAKGSSTFAANIARAKQELAGQGVDVSTADIADALGASGMDTKMAFMSGGGMGPGPEAADHLKAVVKESSKVDFTISENAGALANYVDSLKDTKSAAGSQKFGEARAAMARIGVNAKGLDEIAKNYEGMTDAKKKGALQSFRTLETFGATQAFGDIMVGVQGLAEEVLGRGEASRDPSSAAARERFEDVLKTGDRQALFSAMTEGGALGDYLKRHNKTFALASEAMGEDITGKSAKELAQKYGISDVSSVQAMQAEVASGRGTLDGARRALAGGLLSQAAGSEGTEQDRERDIAKHLNSAATKLAELGETIRTMKGK